MSNNKFNREDSNSLIQGLESSDHVHDENCSHHHSYHQPFERDFPKLGRNEACFCGSGKKYKKCCLA
jgi:preprotein translocase subunit SecA